MKRQRPQISNFTIGWICALPLELTAAKACLDAEYEDFPEWPEYVFGRIGQHNVVLVCLPAGRIGISPASVTATKFRMIFPNIKFGFMVGIGGGVPSSNNDVRLGDVVISQPCGSYGGVVQWDFGKKITGEDYLRTGSLNAPPSELLTAVSSLRSSQERASRTIYSLASRICLSPESDPGGAGTDVLFRPDYAHEGGETCQACRVDQQIARSQRHVRDATKVHYGTVASGNGVFKDGTARDDLSQKLGGVLCFEMEAAGLMNDFPCLVVRGISDYADSHKNKQWQPYAAAAAAACAGQVMSYLPLSRPVPSFGVANSASPGASLTHNTNASNTDLLAHLMDSLRFDQLGARQDTIKKAHTSTCRWLLSEPSYLDWLDDEKKSDHNGIFWISGKPGTGKSTMMKFALAEANNSTKNTIVLAFFFNARGDELEKTTLGMYRSLLHQLLEKSSQAREHVTRHFHRSSIYGNPYEWDISTLQRLFRQVVATHKSTDLTCFIDALDECDEHKVRAMLDFFEELSDLPDISLRLFLSSRHYPNITVEKRVGLKLEGRPGHKEDIVKYIRSKLQKLGRKTREQIEETMLRKSSEIFLWVVLVIPMLKPLCDRGDPKALRERLDEIPPNLDELLNDILTRDRENVEELVLCLQWILYAKRPMQCPELYYAILSGSASNDLSAWDRECITADNMYHFVLSRSKGLAEVTKSKKAPVVQFIHESVREFLLKENGLARFHPSLNTNIAGTSHESLKECCQRYFSASHSSIFGEECWSAANAGRLSNGKEQELPFLEYSVQNVLFHADAASARGIDQCSFLENFPLRNWTELRNSYERYPIRQYTPSVSLLYVMAEQNLANLISIELKRQPHMEIRGERYGYPLFAAVHNRSENALRALLAPDPHFEGLEESDPVTDCALAVTDLLEDAKKLLKVKAMPLLTWVATQYHGKTDLVRALLRTGKVPATISSTRAEKEDLLRSLLRKGRVDVVKFLLNTDPAFITCKDVFVESVFEFARTGRDELLGILLNAFEVTLDSKNSRGCTPLLLAAQEGHREVVSRLLEAGAGKSRDHYLCASLTWAIVKGHSKTFQTLLDDPDVRAALVELTSYREEEVSSRVEEDHHGRVSDHILRCCVAPGICIGLDKDGYSILTWSASKGRTRIMKTIIDHGGFDLDHEDGGGRRALSCAGRKGHGEIVDILLHTGKTDMPYRDEDGNTALHHASRSDHAETVKLLLGFDETQANSKNNNGETALHIAASLGHDKVVDFLLKSGSFDLDLRNNLGQTPLWLAARSDRCQIVERLLSAREVDVNATDKDGRTALWVAAEGGHKAVVKLLLSVDDVDPNTTDKRNITSLMAAITPSRDNQATHEDREETVRLLFRHPNINVNLQDRRGETALTMAAHRGYTAIVEMLLGHEQTNVNLQNLVGGTALIEAAIHRHTATVKMLLGYEQTDVNLQDSAGDTALMIVIRCGYTAIVEMLLGHEQTNVNLQDSLGGTALTTATQKGFAEIAEMIEKAQALRADSGGTRKGKAKDVVEEGEKERLSGLDEEGWTWSNVDEWGETNEEMWSGTNGEGWPGTDDDDWSGVNEGILSCSNIGEWSGATQPGLLADSYTDVYEPLQDVIWIPETPPEP